MTLRLALRAVFLSSLISTQALAGSFVVGVEEGGGAKPRVVTAPRDTGDAVMIVSFSVGSVDDGIKSGLLRLTQHMLLDGNRLEERGAFRRDLYAAAADVVITTEVRRSTVELRAPRGSFEGLATRLLALIFEPKLDKRALARCKRLTRNDELQAGGRDDIVSFLAGSLVLTEGGEDAGADFTNKPYGDDDVIRRLGFSDVEKHARWKLTPANATIVLAGGFDAAAMQKALARYEGGKRRALARPDVTASLPLRLSLAAPRDVFVTAHVIELETPEQAAVAHMLEAVLEERARRRLRAAGVSDALDAFTLRREWLDLLVVEVPVTSGPGLALDTELRALAGDLRSGTFLPGEFERNKRFALARLERTDDDAGALASALADSAGRVSWHSVEVRAALSDMTQAVFLGHARRWLDDKRSIRISVGPAEGAQP